MIMLYFQKRNIDLHVYGMKIDYTICLKDLQDFSEGQMVILNIISIR